MQPTEYYYKPAIIRRRVWINAVFVMVGFAALGLNGLASPYITTFIALFIALYFYRFIRDIRLSSNPPPAVIISDEGILDRHLGKRLVPWEVITEIKASQSPKSFGGGVFLIADGTKLSFSPGPAMVRLANWLRNDNTKIALPMTPVLTLETSLDDLLEDLRQRGKAEIDILPPYPG